MSGIRDHAINWARQRHYVEAVALSGLAADGTNLIGTTAVIKEVAALGFAGVNFAAANDKVRHLMPVPTDWDLQKPIGITLQVATGSVTQGDGITFLVHYGAFDLGDTIAAPATDLDTDIAELEVPAGATALDLMETSRGIISGGKLHKGGLLALDIEVSASDVDLGTEDILLLAVAFDYMPRKTFGPYPVDLDRPFSRNYNNE